MIQPNKITLYSIDDIISFILKKVALLKVRNVQIKICDLNDKHLMTVLLDMCFVFNTDYIAATVATPSGRYLIPCLIALDDYFEVKEIINELLIDIPKRDLGIDITNESIIADCIYNDRQIVFYDQKNNTCVKKEETINNDLLDFLENFIDSDIFKNNNEYEDEDDDDYDV